MTGWFSRRSGSRVSIHNPVRRVLQALSLSRNPMPPRTTRKSDRRKVSDRTMVGTAQPLCLSALGTDGRRYESTMNLRGRKTHSVSFHYWGWMARPFSRGLTVVREVFVLTSLFIERDYRNVGIDAPRVDRTLGIGGARKGMVPFSRANPVIEKCGRSQLRFPLEANDAQPFPACNARPQISHATQ
jgi:hypothetical protein